ncbi:hypothetical protein E4V51_18960 [Paenibacillus sp. 28ISP30-2]|nr:IS66 family transposase zinc-finger binding domain-containing protein [Paenibacillus sp. 23TSA30-6]MBE0339743.1 hypothetical protein [Paenibacillus sp. 23TSA30-6]MBE0342761.1 hypothetical protein [Paenibacillus sp. 28ISP30-2]
MENQANSPSTIEELQQQKVKLKQQNAELTAKLKWYEEQFRLAQHKRFGTSSEKTPPNKLEMNQFNEAEVLATLASEEPQTETITYIRKKWTDSREAKLEQFPVDTLHYELPEEEQVCACCGGELHPMSTETRNEITVIPAEVRVLRHVRLVYACRRCEREEIQTPIVTVPIPKSTIREFWLRRPFWSNVMNQKYVESQPLYRQEQQLAVSATDPPRTSSNSPAFGARALDPFSPSNPRETELSAASCLAAGQLVDERLGELPDSFVYKRSRTETVLILKGSLPVELSAQL